MNATHLSVMPLPLLTQKNLRNKKDHGSRYHSGRDRKGQLYGHVTLTYKVKCECYASECYAVDFTDSKNLRNKKRSWF